MKRFNDGGIYTAEMGKPPTDPEGVPATKPVGKPAAKKPAPKKPAPPKDTVFREGMPVPQDIDGKSAPRKFSKGGVTRADGIAKKGHTRGRMI
jgi:hypothetical protein